MIRWMEINDAGLNISEILIYGDKCFVPAHIYEDSLVEDFYDKIISEENNYLLFPLDLRESIQKARIKSYSACIWYPEIEKVVPTAQSKLFLLNSHENLLNNIKENIHEYPFVRLCSKSPKDVKPVPIYNDATEAYNDIIRSNRTHDFMGKHLFMREEREYLWEARCFFSRDKLRAVSLPLHVDGIDNNIIIDFFDKYGKFLPYHSVMVDIGETIDKNIEIIELNSFGPDMLATAGNFSWAEEFFDLLYSRDVIFR